MVIQEVLETMVEVIQEVLVEASEIQVSVVKAMEVVSADRTDMVFSRIA